VTTADAEARDITSFAASTHSRDNKDVAHTEQLLQLPRRPTLTKLNMQGGEGFFVFGQLGAARGSEWPVVRCRHRDYEGHPRRFCARKRADCSAGIGRHPEPALL
jgi:hypothetical protein